LIEVIRVIMVIRVNRDIKGWVNKDIIGWKDGEPEWLGDGEGEQHK
jgi:hypothetical protein